MQPVKALWPVSVTEVLSYLNKSTQLILCNYFSLREKEREREIMFVFYGFMEEAIFIPIFGLESTLRIEGCFQ